MPGDHERERKKGEKKKNMRCWCVWPIIVAACGAVFLQTTRPVTSASGAASVSLVNLTQGSFVLVAVAWGGCTGTFVSDATVVVGETANGVLGCFGVVYFVASGSSMSVGLQFGVGGSSMRLACYTAQFQGLTGAFRAFQQSFSVANGTSGSSAMLFAAQGSTLAGFIWMPSSFLASVTAPFSPAFTFPVLRDGFVTTEAQTSGVVGFNATFQGISSYATALLVLDAPVVASSSAALPGGVVQGNMVVPSAVDVVVGSGVQVTVNGTLTIQGSITLLPSASLTVSGGLVLGGKMTTNSGTALVVDGSIIFLANSSMLVVVNTLPPGASTVAVTLVNFTQGGTVSGLAAANATVSDSCYAATGVSIENTGTSLVALVTVVPTCALSSGQIAGIIVGSVVGGLLIVALLVFATRWCRKRRDRIANAGIRQKENNDLRELKAI